MRPSENRPSRPKRTVKYVESSSEDQDESTDEEADEVQPTSSSRSKSKRKKTEEDDASCLPPEFRSAGLVANMEIPKGKVFGPFSGVINAGKQPPTSFFTLVCKVKDAISHKFNYFYTKKAETHKSDWLKMIQAPHGNQDHNFTAYNTEKGVCYEAINHINSGEELLVLFQEDKLGAPKKCTILTPRKRQSVIKSTKVTKASESGSKNLFEPVPPKKEGRRRKGAPKKVVKNFLGSEEPFDASNSDEEDQVKKQSELNPEVEEQLSAIGGTPEKNGGKQKSGEPTSKLRKRRRTSLIDLNDLISSADESEDSDEEGEEHPSDKEFDPTEGQENQRTASKVAKKTTKKKQKEVTTQKPSPQQESHRAEKVRQSKRRSESEDVSESEDDSDSEDERTLAEEFQYRLGRIEEQTYQLDRSQSLHTRHIYALKSAVQKGFAKLTAEINSLRDAVQTFSAMDMNSYRQETSQVFENRMDTSGIATSAKATSKLESSRVAVEGIPIPSRGTGLELVKPFMECPDIDIQPLVPTSSTDSRTSLDQAPNCTEGQNRISPQTSEPRRSLGPSYENKAAQNWMTPEKNERQETIGLSFENTWISPDTTEHRKTLGLSLESTEAQNLNTKPQIPINGSMLERKERTIPNEKALQSIRKDSCSQQNFAKKLAFDIFPLSELLNSNVLGKMRQGIVKPPLHFETMEWVKETCLTMFPVDGVDPERQWANCVNSINKAVSDYNRRLKRFNVQQPK